MRHSAWIVAVTMSCSAPPPPCPCTAAAPRVKTVTLPCPEPAVAVPSTPPTCGQLALLEARMVAGGKGDKHPSLLEVRAKLAACEDKRPTAAECVEVRRAGVELEKIYGSKHPERIMNAAEQALCDH